MKAYTLTILSKLSGKDELSGQTEGDDIVNWVNSKVRNHTTLPMTARLRHV